MAESVARMEETRRFERELEPLLPSAFSTAWRLSGNRDDAEDLVREASLRAFRAFSQFEAGTNFRGWFFKILYNVFAREYARKRRAASAISLEEAPELFLFTQAREAGLLDGNQNPVERIIGKLDSERIAQALDGLPEEFRDACILYFAESLSYQEIADILNIPIGTVRSKLHRGRKHLQKALWDVASEMGVVK
jgi:RNA polymerase sigma-70 factor (ECF subfamily)